MPEQLNEPWWIDLIKAFLIINLVLGAFAYMTWVERKLLGRMQARYGPNRAGPFGLLQPIADLVKLLRKESFYPSHAVDVLYIAMPAVAAFTALAAFSVIPFGGVWHVGEYDITGWVANVSSASCSSSRWEPSESTPSSSAAGRAIRSTRCSARCARQRSSSRTGVARALGARRRADGRLALPRGHRRRAAGDDLVRGAAAIGLLVFFIAGSGRDEPAAVRPARGGDRARRRLPHRVQRHAVRHLLDGRVHQHDHGLGHRRDALLRRLGRPLLPGPFWLIIKLVVFAFLFMWMRATLPRLRYDQLMQLRGGAPAGRDLERSS